MTAALTFATLTQSWSAVAATGTVAVMADCLRYLNLCGPVD
jgi:hypothetical protein